MKEDPPLEAKCRDKFLVQSVAVPGNQEFADVRTHTGSARTHWIITNSRIVDKRGEDCEVRCTGEENSC